MLCAGMFCGTEAQGQETERLSGYVQAERFTKEKLNTMLFSTLVLGTLAALVTLVLLVSALLIRRQVREMANMTVELAASHNHLEERVQEATLELAGQKDEAERANTAKSRFLAAASHDLRQPLHALSLFSADLQRQVRSGTAQELPRLAEQISASTSLLGELLDSLLDKIGRAHV